MAIKKNPKKMAGDGADKAGGTRSGRELTVRVKTAKKRTVSSARWLKRQLNDPYVVAAKRDGYRSRAAYKLVQLDEKFHLLKPGLRVVDLGAAPGGWSQVAAHVIFGKAGATKKNSGKLIALDILEMEPIEGAIVLHQDFTTDDAPEKIKAALMGEADLVLSDMAAPTTGHNATDHLRIMGMADLAYDFARGILSPGGAFVCKLFQGGAERALLNQLRLDFKTVKHAKPQASRSDSAEIYVVAQGFRALGIDLED